MNCEIVRFGRKRNEGNDLALRVVVDNLLGLMLNYVRYSMSRLVLAVILVLVCSSCCQDRQYKADHYARGLRILFDDPRMKAIILYEVGVIEKQDQKDE